MTKVWIVNLITGVICMGIVSGCSVKNVKIEKVNKEMKESKEEHALDKSQIEEQMIDEKGVVGDIELLAFYEPPEYQPPQKWLGTFKDKTLAEPS